MSITQFRNEVTTAKQLLVIHRATSMGWGRHRSVLAEAILRNMVNVVQPTLKVVVESASLGPPLHGPYEPLVVQVPL